MGSGNSRNGTTPKGVHTDLTAHVPADLPPVDVVPDRIQQVLANLLGNARRHTSPGGQVTLAGRRTLDGHAAIDVTDTGQGIVSDHLPHLFERFYRGDASRRSGAGSGIGLTIARAIVRAHGGDLTAHSDGTQQGATFTRTLPHAPDGRSAGPRASPIAEGRWC